jgi:hypothetical protein
LKITEFFEGDSGLSLAVNMRRLRAGIFCVRVTEGSGELGAFRAIEQRAAGQRGSAGKKDNHEGQVAFHR